MSIQRHVPIHMEPSRWYPTDFSDAFFTRDPHWTSFNEAFKGTARDPFRDFGREPPRELVRDVREPAVYHAPSPTFPGPLSRSFFNPERQLGSMDVEMQRMAQEMKRMFYDMQHLMPVDANPESWRKKVHTDRQKNGLIDRWINAQKDMQQLKPIDANPESWRKKENYLLDNPVYHDQSGREMFRLQFDVRQFKPDEIFVKTLGNQLTVHAKHEEKTEGKSLHREYHRQYVLPKDVNPETLMSKLNRDGVLTIEAPLPITDGPRDRLIPIKNE